MIWKLVRPTESWAPRQLRLLRADMAVGVYEPLAVEGLPDGELWTTPLGKVLVLGSLNRLCPRLQTVAGLNFDEVLIAYPQDSRIDLRGVCEFQLLPSELKVTVEAGEKQWAEAQGLMDDLSREYQPPEYGPPPAEHGSWLTRVWKGAPINRRLADQVEEAARSLLWYEAERDPLRMRTSLNLLRHLDQVALCDRVLKIHTQFYRDGVFETHKDYPSARGVEVVGRNLERLYAWAATPAWDKARSRRRIRGLPAVWRPSPVKMEPLTKSAFQPAEPAPEGHLEYERFVNEFDLPRLEGLRSGAVQFRDYILSNALYGEASAIAVVACLEDALGPDGVKAMLVACLSEQDLVRRMARQWLAEERLGHAKVQAYLGLREDQAEGLPPLSLEGAPPAERALYRFLVEGTARGEDAQAVTIRVKELLNPGLRHRLNLRLDIMPPSWLTALYPHLGESRWLPLLSQLDPPRTNMTLGAVAELDSSTARFYWNRIEREELRGGQLLHLCRDLVASFDFSEHRVSLWRPWNRQAQELDVGFHFHSPVAYSPRRNLLLSVSFDAGSTPEIQLVESGLPADLKPKKRPFRCRALNLLFSPLEDYLICWGTQGFYVYRTGEWDEPVLFAADQHDSVSFSPDERYLLAGSKLYSMADFQELGQLSGPPHNVVWAEDTLITRSGGLVESYQLPSLCRLGRLGGLRPGSVSLQSGWCLVAREERLERFAYPALERTATYDLRVDRALLTPDQKVLLTLHPESHLLHVRSWDAETLQEIARSDSFPGRGSGFRLSPDGRFALIVEATACHLFSFCADHRVTADQASDGVLID